MKRKLIFTGILSFFLIGIAYSQQNCAVNQLCKVSIADFSGGMNSNTISDRLQPNTAASAVNVVIDQPGLIEKRGGVALFNTDTGDSPFTGIGRFDPDAATSYLVVASGDNVARSTVSATQWTLASPSTAVTSGQETEFIQANDLLFILNGFDPTSYYNGTSFVRSGSYPSSPPTATTGAWLRNYLFLAGGTTEDDWVYFSNNLDPTTFDASDIIKINTGDGQKIQHLEPFRLNELIIYKERSIFVLDISGTTPLSDWTVQPISTKIGTIASRSVVSLGNDQWFLSSDPIAIRSLVRSQFDKILLNTVSDPIQDIWDRTGPNNVNINQISKSAAVLFDNKYMLAYPSGTSASNDTVVVHDFGTNGWYLIKGWYPKDWVVFNNSLYYIDANDGSVIQCFTSTYADFAKGPQSRNGATPSVPIAFDYISRSIDYDIPENFKMPDALEVEFDPTGSYQAVVWLDLDGKGWASIGTVSLNQTGLTVPFTLPSPLGDAGLARKTFQTQSKGEYKKMQIRVRQDGLNERVRLQRVTTFDKIRPWRRE